MSVLKYTEVSPEEIVKYYYHAIATGDLQSLKFLMTPKSYFMTLEAFALRLSFKDREFKLLLSQLSKSEEALLSVEKRLLKEGSFKKPFPAIKIETVKENGPERQIVVYREEGITKKLYFSYESTGWKINYYAGRRADSHSPASHASASRV